MFRKIIKKIKNSMSTQVKDKQQEIWYVWTKSERVGDIVQPAEVQDDAKWLKFTDGTQINKSIIKEFLMSAKSEQEAKVYSLDLNPIGSSVNSAAKPVAVKQEAPKQERRITDGKSAPTPEVNVMMEMLKKISKKNKAAMPVEVNIPAKEVYEMLQDQMDMEAAELNEQIGLLVESQIDNLRKQLKEQIETFISNYYTNESRNNKRAKSNSSNATGTDASE